MDRRQYVNKRVAQEILQLTLISQTKGFILTLPFTLFLFRTDFLIAIY